MDTIVVNRPKQDPFHLFLDAALKTVAYLRVSTRSQDLANQKLAILEFSQKRRFPIDQFIESRISSRKSPIERRIDEMLGMLQPGDRLLVSELSRLGRSLSQVIQIVETLVRRKIRFIAIKEAIEFDGKQDLRTKVMICSDSFARAGPDLRTDQVDVLAAAIGRPKGAFWLGKGIKQIRCDFRPPLYVSRSALYHFIQAVSASRLRTSCISNLEWTYFKSACRKPQELFSPRILEDRAALEGPRKELCAVALADPLGANDGCRGMHDPRSRSE